MKKNVANKNKATKKVVKKASVAKTKKATPGKVKAKAKVVNKTKPKTKAKVTSKAKPKAKVVTKAKIKTKTAKVTEKTKKTVKATKEVKDKKAPVTKKTTEKPVVVGAKKAMGPAKVRPYSSKKNEEYMNKKQLEHFRSALLKWKGQLMAEVDRTKSHMQDDVSNYPDPVDRASQEEEFSLELRARDRERKLLRKIEDALNRISEDDYGYCNDCGAEIGVRRLEARPTATQCIECKTISELKEKQVGDGNLFD